MNNDEELQKAILDNIPDQAWLKDRQSRYVLVNEAFIAACRTPEHLVIGKTPTDIWPPAWGQKYLETDRLALERGRLRYEESRIVDGMLRWYDTIKTAVRDKAGEVVGTVGISRDITDRKLAEQELAASRAQLRELAAYLQSVREEERVRISRELHDDLGQSLTAIRIGLDVLQTQFERGDAQWKKNLHGIKAIAATTLESVQRIASDLRPLLLDELGLQSAIEWLADSFAQRSGIVCGLELPDQTVTFDNRMSTGIFRILQEALTNIERHSRASSVSVRLFDGPTATGLEVCDNGQGMILRTQEKSRAGLGLIGMRERAIMLGGALAINSSAGQGVRIVLRIPKSSAAPIHHNPA